MLITFTHYIIDTHQNMKLSELTDNQEGIIIKVQGYGAFRKRITEMGFIKGKK